MNIKCLHIHIMGYTEVRVENETFIVFNYHFTEGRLAQTRIGQVFKGEIEDKRIIYNKETNKMFVDCSLSLFKEIMKGLFCPNDYDIDYFMGIDPNPLICEGGYKEISILKYGMIDENYTNDNEDIDDLENMFNDIDTVSTPSIVTNKLTNILSDYGINTDIIPNGTKEELQLLSNNICNQINGKDSHEIIRALSNDKNIINLINENNYLATESPTATLNLDTIDTTTELKTDSEFKNMTLSDSVKSNYVSIN